jgi:eukaryotic-like serine/threonine-protein kinase
VLSPGTTLGHYEIRSQIGAGGMGEVYLARDCRLDRKVALKILPLEVAGDSDRMKRFVQEARAASGLNHPNIITIYEIDQSESPPFIATEFIDGTTLRERLKGKPLPTAEVLNIAVQIAAALDAAHENGIVHRDIKPENIIVRRDGIAKVLDFGLAKLTGQGSLESTDSDAPTRGHFKTDSGVVMGTATYMSPEQARGQQVDARTDIFSLGVVIYELLTGQRPFEGASVYEVVAAILSDKETQPLSYVSPEVPEELERIVAKALRKNREQRYQTIKDLLLDLESLKQKAEFERTHHRIIAPRRLPLLVWGILVLVVGVIGYVWWEQSRALQEPQIRSLAVLPLKSLDAGENYLGLGIADAAIRRVSQTGRVIVRPTSAVRRYLTQDTDALSAAKQLGVDSVLEGSFQRSGDRLRVSVNLLRVSDGASLWADSFDLRMADIFAIQDTVAQQVASHLRLELDASQQAQLTKHPTSNPVAYDFYLKGMYTFDQRISRGRDTKTQLDSAIDFYMKAIDADPNFALAHAQLAYVYSVRAVFLEPTQPLWVELAKQEINRAQLLDPQLAETHLARFQLLYSQFEGYQGEAALREMLLANKLNPNVGHSELAYMYIHLGLEDLAARELQLASEVDPTSEYDKSTKLLVEEVTGNFDEYFAQRNGNPNDRMDALYFMRKRRFDEAEQALNKMGSNTAGARSLPPTRAVFLALKGDLRAAEAEIPNILKLHPVKDPLYHHATYDIACIYAMEGKSAEAVKWLRESTVSGYHLYPRYQRDNYFDPIRQSPEFIRFMTEMKAENEKYRQEFGQ